MPADFSNGYEAIASRFIESRSPDMGATVVAEWSRVLAPGSAVLDLGCGSGAPISQVLADLGFAIHGVDASPSMAAAFAKRFPNAPVECAAVENCSFLNRTFDAIVSWGLFFLLDAGAQRKLIARVSDALRPGGRFLFTAPSQACSWADSLTGLPSVSLGEAAYRIELEAAGLALTGTRLDEGGNHYSLASVTPRTWPPPR